MNFKSLSVKLQTALCQKKRYVRINTFQSYSESAERMVTKYVLQEKQRDMQGKETIITLFSSYQMADVVKELAKLYRETDS